MKIISLEELPEVGVSHNPEIRKKVLLARGDVPHVTNLSQSVLLPGQCASAHTHTGMTEVFYALSGNGMIRVGDERRALAEDTCAVVEPGEEHEIVNTGTEPLVLLYFGVET